jgi:hypothetical protein
VRTLWGVIDADGLPVKLGPCSTDEFSPRPLDPVTAEAVRLARQECEDNARRVGMPRREFLRSVCALRWNMRQGPAT